MNDNWANTVKAEIANTVVTHSLKTCEHRNAYRVILLEDYNPGTSVQHPSGMKMYAELTRNQVLEVEDKKPLR